MQVLVAQLEIARYRAATLKSQIMTYKSICMALSVFGVYGEKIKMRTCRNRMQGPSSV